MKIYKALGASAIGFSVLAASAFFIAPAFAAVATVVTPASPNGWYLYNDQNDGVQSDTVAHGFVAGPATPPAGIGSVHLTKTAADSYGIATAQFAGTPLGGITALQYSTYRASGTAAQAPSLGFDVDSDTTDTDNSYQGRLTYEPYFTQTVSTGAWQTWDALDDAAGTGTGNWWFSHATLSGGAASACTQANPCTWSELKAAYPHAAMRSAGQLILRTNGANGEAFDGNVDNFTIRAAGIDKSFDFEQTPPEACNGSTFDALALGSANGQDGWQVSNPAFDQAIVSNTYGYPSLGCKTLRISDSVTSGSFGDQIFSPSVANEAGESAAVSGGISGGTRQNHFEAQFDLASVQAAIQSGMHVSVSPDRGDGSRMSYLRFEDQADGIHVYFDDVPGGQASVGTAGEFAETDIATLSRAPHTVKFDMTFVDGPSNDVVKIYIDGTLVKTGTSWEDYYRYDPEQAGNGNQVPTVDSLLFRESGTATPANAGKGFLIDNVSLASQAYANDPAQSKFAANPAYVRVHNAGDAAATALVPNVAQQTRFTFTQTDGSNVYANVAGVEHLQTGQFPIPATGQHQYRVGVSAEEGTYTVTGEYQVGAVWYPITGNATVYVVGNPTGSFVIPSATSNVFRPSDNPARVSADDANDSFRDVVFNVDGTMYQVNRAQCDLREAGHRVLCDVSDSSAWTGGLADGAHAVSATLYNKASNHTALASVGFTVDSSGPVVTNFVINPAASVYTGAIDASADATDADSGIKNVSFFITAPRAGDGVCDGNGAHLADSQVTTPVSGTTYSASLDTSGLSGAYCVDAVAENLASGHSLPQKISVTIDNANTAPTVPTLLSPADGSTLGTNEFDFAWNPSTDAQSDAIAYQYQASQDSVQTGGVLTNGLWTSPAPLTTPMIHSSGAGDGTWYWQVRAQDAAGNWSGWSTIWSVKLDTVSAPAPTPGVATNDANPITSTDATLNGTNGDIAADNTSFWWGTTAAGPFAPAADPSAQLPSGWTNHPTGTGAKSIGGSFSYALAGLVPNTTYYFAAWSQVGGVWYPGSILSFITSDNSAPSASGAVTTNAANPIGLTDATLNGTNGDTAADNTSFWWGTTAAGPFAPAADPSAQLPSGWTNHPTGTGARPIGGSFSYALSGLAASTPQYFVAWSQVGGVWYPGEVLSFTTGTPAAVSHAPTASGVSATLDENTPTDIALVANDEDGNPLTYSVVGSPAHGTVTVAGNTATYTPATGYFGGDAFTFKANDGSSDSNTALVTITVREVAPTTHTITASAGANGSITPSGAVSVTNGASQAFTITPDAGFHVADVLVDDASVGAVTSYAFSANAADHTISASFEADAQVRSFTASSRRNGGGGQILGAATGPGEVKGAETGPAECANGPLITSYMRMGADNDQDQVKLLQAFLAGEMGTTTPVTGLFDAQTDTTVKAFQLKYAGDILAPWSLSEPTGWVYLLTLWKINSIACPTIDTPKPGVKGLEQGGMGDGTASTTVASVAGKVVLPHTKVDENAMGGAGDGSQAAANASSTPSWFGKFVNWLFGR